MSEWVEATTVSELDAKGAMVFRSRGRQIALFRRNGTVHACNNRCPHEGYPLSEGTLDGGCVLTCNWHNWKFDLSSGENLYGGDRLRVYPVEIRGESVWVDLADPPVEVRKAAILDQLHEAYLDNDYARMARELARLAQLGVDPLEAWVCAIEWSFDRFEFGWTHAYAGLADWLRLYDENDGDAERQLICLLEGLAHVADDALREQRYPFTDAHRAFEHMAFLDAIEREDVDAACAMVRGAIDDGTDFAALEPSFAEAALSHYNDFGHSLIYVDKVSGLVQRLGDAVMAPLLLSLVRSLVFARREDLIPEFRAYGPALARWGDGAAGQLSWHDLRGLGVERCLDAVVAHSATAPDELYPALLGVNAANMLAYELEWQDKVAIPISDNVGWLDFTHGLTFANAVREQCTRYPWLWPAGLLQLACFAGRNTSFTQDDDGIDEWRVHDPERFYAEAIESLYDHGKEEFIVSVHLLKTVLAARDEVRGATNDDAAMLTTAAINRFLHSPLKRKHVRRTVHQAVKFVARDA